MLPRTEVLLPNRHHKVLSTGFLLEETGTALTSRIIKASYDLDVVRATSRFSLAVICAIHQPVLVWSGSFRAKLGFSHIELRQVLIFCLASVHQQTDNSISSEGLAHFG